MHFHGTPITPRTVLYELAGRCFCVPYASPQDAEVCHEIGQSVMLDNGAFTFWRENVEGRKPSPKARAAAGGDWSGYYEWCARWLEHWTTWAVIPDVIDGGEAEGDALIREWPFGDRGAPVWHMHESLNRLRRLVDEWPLICIGSSGEYATIKTPAWRGRMIEAMRVACDPRGVPLTRLHMLRGLDFAGGPYPFYSADSTNIARNHAGTNGGRPRRSAARMAAEIDARQTPARWIPAAPQLALGAVA